MSSFAAMAAFAFCAMRACADCVMMADGEPLCCTPAMCESSPSDNCSAVGSTAHGKIQDVYARAIDVDEGSGLCGEALLAYLMPAWSESISFIPSVHLHSLGHFDWCGCAAFLVLVSLRPMLRTMIRHAAGQTGKESRLKVRQSMLWRFGTMPWPRFVIEVVLTGLLMGPLVCWSIVVSDFGCLVLATATCGDVGLFLLCALQEIAVRRRMRPVECNAWSVQLWIVNPSGQHLQLDLAPTCTVEQVQLAVAEITGIPTQWLRMSHNGRLCTNAQLLSDIGCGAVLRVRAFPLKGGVGRDVESLKTFLATLLISHGVPQDVLQHRIGTILDKVSLSTLRQVASSDNPWASLKSACNDHMIRILQPEELKAYSDRRKLAKQSDSLLPKGSGRGRHAGLSSSKSARSNLPTVHVTDIDPKLVHVDVQHFKVPEGGGLVRRDSLKFPSEGPGLYVMLLDSIMPYLPPRPLHLDATVVFVIGRLAPGIGKFVELPASDEHGRPILVPGTVVQFGSVVADFVASCPSVDFNPIPTTPVELKIVRELVADEWQSVVVDPLSYAAQAVPALKTEGAISHSWARHFYSDLRKKCRPLDAHHFHGYFLLLDSVLEAALRDSGTKGVFLCPRSPDKTRDHRFRVIPCVGPLEVTKAKAHGCERALGLTQLQSGYGILVKQEYFNEVKAQVAPGALLERVVEPSSMKFLALNLPNTLSATQVSSALRMLGWSSANAIRPLRAKTWLIGADQNPPSFHFRLGEFTVMVAPFDPTHGPSDHVLVSQACASQDEPMEPKFPVQEKFDCLQISLRHELQSLLREGLSANNEKLEQRMSACEMLGASNVEAIAQVQQALVANESQVCALSHRVQSLEADVKASHCDMIHQMKELFAQHDSRLESRLEQTFGSQHARISAVELAMRERDVRRKPDDGHANPRAV